MPALIDADLESWCHVDPEMVAVVHELADRGRTLGLLSNIIEELVPIWEERQQLLLSWLPNVEPFVLPRATHLLHIENPHDMAEGLAGFFKRHPLKGAA